MEICRGTLQPTKPQEVDDELEESGDAPAKTASLPSLELLRSKKVCFAPKCFLAELRRIEDRIERQGAPNGYQSTSNCGSMYKVLESELRRTNGSISTLLAVTVAFKEDHYCFHDTDIPEVGQELILRLAKLWQSALGVAFPLDDQSKAGILFMLNGFKEQVPQRCSQRGPERRREAQRASERHRDAQGGPGTLSHMELQKPQSKSMEKLQGRHSTLPWNFSRIYLGL